MKRTVSLENQLRDIDEKLAVIHHLAKTLPLPRYQRAHRQSLLDAVRDALESVALIFDLLKDQKPKGNKK